MIHEVREYVPMPGRLGDVVELFNTVTIALFRKHGMEIGHLGVTTFGERSFGEIVYTLKFESMADLEAKWAAFLADPEWTQALDRSEETGPLYQSIRRRVIDSGFFEGA